VTRLNGHVSGFSAVSQASTVVAHLSVNGRSVESMAYAPNGTLVFSDGPGFPDLILGQESATNEYYTNLSGVDTDGPVGVVPTGFGGAGTLKATSAYTGKWYNVSLTNPSGGIYQVSVSGPNATSATAPSAFAFAPQGFSSAIAGNSILLADSTSANIVVSNVDPNTSDPTSVTGTLLSNAQIIAMAKDPLTNDVLLVTNNSELYLIRATLPPATVPEPGSALLLLSGLVILFRRGAR